MGKPFGSTSPQPKNVVSVPSTQEISGFIRISGEGSGNPVGDILPGFTVHNVRAGFRFFAGGFEKRLDLALTNLTDELYAEAANSTFFRPEPRRGVALTLSTAF